MAQAPAGFVPDGFVPDAKAAPYIPPADNPRIGAPKDTEGVTLGDLLDDPKAAILRAGHLVAKDLSDPKILAGVAASFLVPKAIAAVTPGVSAALGTVKAAKVGPELAKMAAGYRVGKGIEAAEKISTAWKARTIGEMLKETKAAAPRILSTSDDLAIRSMMTKGMSENDAIRALLAAKTGAR